MLFNYYALQGRTEMIKRTDTVVIRSLADLPIVPAVERNVTGCLRTYGDSASCDTLIGRPVASAYHTQQLDFMATAVLRQP